MTLAPTSSAAQILALLQAVGTPERAARSRTFFKTGPGEYGEGDQFLGIAIPQLRTYARSLRGIDASVLAELLASPWHEARGLALLTMTLNATSDGNRAYWAEQYRTAVRAGRVNNWDLVDLPVGPILGDYLVQCDDHRELAEWATSDDLWERRIGIVGTSSFLRVGRSDAILSRSRSGGRRWRMPPNT